MIPDMAPPKKHKKRPATAKDQKKAGWTPKFTMTLDAQTIIRLEEIREFHELANRSDTMRFLAKEEAARIARREKKE